MAAIFAPACIFGVVGSRNRRIITSSSSSSTGASTTSRASEGWSKFAKRVSGEWSGCGVDFDRHGKALPLPEALVPDEYKEWNVEVYDWETYCATLARDEPRSLYNKTLRLYPTAGCGATTVTIYSTEEQTFSDEVNDDAKSKASFLAFHTSGAYLAVSRKTFGKVIPVFEVEHCLPKDDQRVRILQKLEAATLYLLEITVFREQWEEPFRSGESVISCLTNHAALSRTPCPPDAFLEGTWRSVRSSFSVVEDGSSQGLLHRLKPMDMSADGLRVERNSLKDFTLLPSGFWSNITRARDDAVNVEAGWLKEPGVEGPATAVVSRCKLTSCGIVESAELETQYRESAMDLMERNSNVYHYNL